MPLGLFLFFFFGGHLPQTSGFRSAKQILVVSFATQARAFILSDRNIFYILEWGGGGGRTTAGSNAPGAFLVCVREFQTVRMKNRFSLFCFSGSSFCAFSFSLLFFSEDVFSHGI